jgi:hemerythrin-like domain-containing protein
MRSGAGTAEPVGAARSAASPTTSTMRTARTRRRPTESRSAQAFLAQLRLDHARLSRVLREVEVQRVRLASEPASARAVLGEALRYLLQYQHRHHHPREDRLFERLALVRDDLGAELRGLGREHDTGVARARALAAAVADRADARFARELQAYVDDMRDHMRREERAVIYAGAEPWLTGAEWQALSADAAPDDPLGDAAQLRREYPQLAAALAEPVRDVTSAGAITAASTEPRHRSLEALRDGANELVEAYGELLHEGLDLVRGNVATLCGATSPLGAVGALSEVSRRSFQFAARCWTLPSRVALECATRMLAPFAPPPDAHGTKPAKVPDG